MKLILLAFLLFALIIPGWAQTNLHTQADSLFRSQNWQASAKAYEKITKDNPNPKNGMTFNRLATSYYYLGKYAEAVVPFRRAIQISGNPAVMYSLACVFNKMNQKDSCYNWLNKAADKGFNQYQQAETDADLINLTGTPKFEAVLKKIRINAKPCLGLPEYRQFDFWIGNWSVYDTKTNNLAGTSEINNILDECVIMENWRPTAGPAGKSFNMYNAAEKKWRQTYVDASGNFSEYYDGEWSNNKMSFKMKPTADSNQANRLTFIVKSNDEVQQVGEVSTDHGTTWKVEYDLTYRKVK
jgi:tetratricopeptide (TPR) repeat protein